MVLDPELVKDKWKDDFDFTVSFALRLRVDAFIDFWNVTEPYNWRELFIWGVSLHKNNKYRTPAIYVYRPTNKIVY